MVGKFTFVLFIVLTAKMSVAGDAIEGVWLTADGDGLIEIQWQDERLSGVIVGSAGDNKWKGQVYDPNTGKTYQCTLTLVDANTL